MKVITFPARFYIFTLIHKKFVIFFLLQTNHDNYVFSSISHFFHIFLYQMPENLLCNIIIIIPVIVVIIIKDQRNWFNYFDTINGYSTFIARHLHSTVCCMTNSGIWKSPLTCISKFMA